MLVIKTAETVTNIFKLSPTHFVSNIGHQHRFSPWLLIPVRGSMCEIRLKFSWVRFWFCLSNLVNPSIFQFLHIASVEKSLDSENKKDIWKLSKPNQNQNKKFGLNRLDKSCPKSRLNSEKWAYSRNTPKIVFLWVFWVREIRWWCSFGGRIIIRNEQKIEMVIFHYNHKRLGAHLT